MLPPEAIQQFKELYLKRFGELLSNEEAERKAEKFLSLYRAVYLPIPGENAQGSLLP